MELAEKIDPRHTALVVVDVQNDFSHPQGAYSGRAEVDRTAIAEMLPRLAGLIEHARRLGVPTIYTAQIFDDWTISPVIRERRARRGPNFKGTTRRGEWGAEFYEGFEPDPARYDEYVVVKHRPSAFIDTDLDLVLRSRQIKTLVITGIATNVCVESTARDGAMKDYFVVMVDDCCGSDHRHLHDATLETFSRHFGDVARSTDVIAAWSQVSAATG